MVPYGVRQKLIERVRSTYGVAQQIVRELEWPSDRTDHVTVNTRAQCTVGEQAEQQSEKDE